MFVSPQQFHTVTKTRDGYETEIVRRSSLLLHYARSIYPKTLYKAWEAGFKMAKRDPAEQPTYAANLTSELGKVGGSMIFWTKK